MTSMLPSLLTHTGIDVSTLLETASISDISVSEYDVEMDNAALSEQINRSVFDIDGIEFEELISTKTIQIPVEIKAATSLVMENPNNNITNDENISSSEKLSAFNQPPEQGSKEKTKTWKKPKGMPKRPMSAYNLFFQLERERILKDLGEKIFTADDVDRIVRERKILDSKPKPKRKHRKAHGKLGFGEMARVIANKWKGLNEEEKRVFNERAVIEKKLYDKAVEEWSAREEEKARKEEQSQNQRSSTSLKLTKGSSNVETVQSPITPPRRSRRGAKEEARFEVDVQHTDVAYKPEVSPEATRQIITVSEWHDDDTVVICDTENEGVEIDNIDHRDNDHDNTTSIMLHHRQQTLSTTPYCSYMQGKHHDDMVTDTCYCQRDNSAVFMTPPYSYMNAPAMYIPQDSFAAKFTRRVSTTAVTPQYFFHPDSQYQQQQEHTYNMPASSTGAYQSPNRDDLMNHDGEHEFEPLSLDCVNQIDSTNNEPIGTSQSVWLYSDDTNETDGYVNDDNTTSTSKNNNANKNHIVAVNDKNTAYRRVSLPSNDNKSNNDHFCLDRDGKLIDLVQRQKQILAKIKRTAF